MTLAYLAPPFDHGAALRVPPAHDARNWQKLWMWLGEQATALEAGIIQVHTAAGAVVARPGDWIVLSHSGKFHVAHTAPAWNA